MFNFFCFVGLGFGDFYGVKLGFKGFLGGFLGGKCLGL